MFDVIRNQYRLSCPHEDGHVWVSISNFRSIKRLRGAHAPAVFRVLYDCTCGDRHESLVTHDALDWRPLATESTSTFTNLLTGSRELLSHEMAEIARMHIRQGRWPWTFYCHPESALRPGFPSALRMVTPHDGGEDQLGVLVRCFTCARLSVNLVSRTHLDVPFHNDRVIHYVPRILGSDQVTTEEAFRHQLEGGVYRSQLTERRAG